MPLIAGVGLAMFPQITGINTFICYSPAIFKFAGINAAGPAILVAVTFLSLVSFIGQAFTFWLYGLIAIVAWIFFYKLVPETKGKTLEEIEALWQKEKGSGRLKEMVVCHLFILYLLCQKI